MYSSEQSFEVFEFPILTNRSRVWPVYTLKRHHIADLQSHVGLEVMLARCGTGHVDIHEILTA